MKMQHLPNLPQDETLQISSEGLDYIVNNLDPLIPEKNFLWATDYRIQLPVRVKKQGPGSQKPYTFSHMWKEVLQSSKDSLAITYQYKQNQWVSITYGQYFDQCIKFSKALIRRGVQERSTINIIGFNSPEWAFAFSGSILGRYLPIGIYTTNSPETCCYIANHSECKVVVMDDCSQLQKYISIRNEIPSVKYFVLYKQAIPKNLPQDMRNKVISWGQFINQPKNMKGVDKERQEIQARSIRQKPGECCTFIYTSGTTGPPKAVMISHDNYTWTTDATIRKFEFQQNMNKGRVLSLLPLSHVAAQIVDLVLSIRCGFNVFFADPSALQGNLLKFLHASRPTVFMSVPRVWEKIQQKVSLIASQTTGLKRSILEWAKQKAPQGTYAQALQKKKPAYWSVAKKLVFNKIKQNLGLDQCTVFLFSAAPMKESTRLFFLNLNILLHNVYGMSQLSGPETYTNFACWESFNNSAFLKQAGQVIEGLTLFIDKPDEQGNGQICLRGRNVFMGYFKNQEETRKTIDKKGFVHSGDIGKLDKKGNLTITGRIKELIITAGGQNIAPVIIQNNISSVFPIFSHVVVVGDGRKYLAALICLKMKNNQFLADQLLDFLSSKGSSAKTSKDAAQCKIVKAIIQQAIQIANQNAFSNAQRVQKFTILPREFTVANNTLTPTLKLKRKIINELYATQIETMYIDSKL